MAQQWHIKVSEKRRKDVDRALLLQAILALAKHMEAERRQEEAAKSASRNSEEEA